PAPHAPYSLSLHDALPISPRTLDEYRRLGARLKAQGRPVGQSLGHTLGDAPAWAYPLLWAFGGAETDPSGRTVVLNSKEALESVDRKSTRLNSSHVAISYA